MLRKVLPIALLIALVFLQTTPTSCQDNVAKIYGAAYDWFTLEPMPNIVVEINTTPQQTMVADNGEYWFDVPRGEYTIRAGYYQQGVLFYSDEDNISVTAAGNYRLDLILLPTFEENDLPENLSEPVEETEPSNLIVGLAVFAGVAIAGILVTYYGLKRKPKELELQPMKMVALPEDLQQMVNILRENGGRMDQVELRQKIPQSEAKVSLMISDLEDRKLVRKIKRGRGNIVVLNE